MKFTPSRPSESTTGVAGVGALLSIILGVNDPNAIAAMVAGLTVLPAAITSLVSAGGLIGFLKGLLHGREAE